MNPFSLPPSVDTCGEVATLESDGTTFHVEFTRGSGPSADVRPLASEMRLPQGVAAPFAVGEDSPFATEGVASTRNAGRRLVDDRHRGLLWAGAATHGRPRLAVCHVDS
jgi:hypothetical protein